MRVVVKMTEKRFYMDKSGDLYDRENKTMMVDFGYSYDGVGCKRIIDLLNELAEEYQRLTDKLNQTALELVDGVISQGKAVEISEMSYSEFLDYRAKNGKPMELQL